MVFFGSKIIGSEVIGGEITQIIGIEVQLLDIVAFILSIGGSVDNSVGEPEKYREYGTR